MSRILLEGCKAGLLAGVVFGLLLLGFVSPLVQRAEVFENAPTLNLVHEPHDHSHPHPEVMKSEKWERPLLTFVGALLLGVSFGILSSLILFAALRFRFISLERFARQPWWIGLMVGVLGFAIFHGIPALGLRPALPGVAGSEGDHAVRQTWWLVSVASSLSAFLLFVCFFAWARKRGLAAQSVLFGAVVLLLVFPFFGFGVPVYSTASVTPLDLQQRFILVSLVVSAAFWLVLGTIQSYFVYKISKNVPWSAGFIE